MATMLPRAATRRKAARERLFYGMMAVAILVTVFIGFAPTYYLLDSLAGVTPLVHVHAAVLGVGAVVADPDHADRSRPGEAASKARNRGSRAAPVLLVVGTATTIAVAQRISGPPHFAPPGHAMLALVTLVAFGL